MKTELAIFVILVLINCSSVYSNQDGYFPAADGSNIESRDIKCLVCKATVDEMLAAVAKVAQKKRVDVGGYRLDADGNAIKRSVQYSKSETYLTDLMENICDKMDDYAKAKYKKNQQLAVLKLTSDDGMLNPEMSKVDFVQDGDLNKSLKHFCLEVLEDNEEAVLKLFMQDETPKHIDIHLCTLAAKYCDDTLPEDEYVLEEQDDRDEL